MQMVDADPMENCKHKSRTKKIFGEIRYVLMGFHVLTIILLEDINAAHRKIHTSYGKQELRKWTLLLYQRNSLP